MIELALHACCCVAITVAVSVFLGRPKNKCNGKREVCVLKLGRRCRHHLFSLPSAIGNHVNDLAFLLKQYHYVSLAALKHDRFSASKEALHTRLRLITWVFAAANVGVGI